MVYYPTLETLVWLSWQSSSLVMSRSPVRIRPQAPKKQHPTGCCFFAELTRIRSLSPLRGNPAISSKKQHPTGCCFRTAEKVCHCEPVRAAKQVPLGYRLARQSVPPAGRLPYPFVGSFAYSLGQRGVVLRLRPVHHGGHAAVDALALAEKLPLVVGHHAHGAVRV